MTDMTSFERRIAGLIAGYADRAPMEADPTEVARAAATAARRTAWPWRRPFERLEPVAWLAAITALMVGLLGGLLLGGGGPRPLSIASPSTASSVPPTAPGDPPVAIGYLGLPPVEAEPSAPEVGELVLGFNARPRRIIPCCGQLGAWLYEDGRLIWAIEGDAQLQALVEQRLTPGGVEFVLNAARAALSGTEAGSYSAGGGWFFWAALTIRSGDGFVGIDLAQSSMSGESPRLGPLTDTQQQALWSLDENLRNPGEWLPTMFVADAAPRAFVASRYEACAWLEVDPKPSLDRIPEAAATLLRERGTPRATEWATCRTISTEDARSLVTILEAAGWQEQPEGWTSTLTYTPGPGMPAAPTMAIDPILPHGESCCRGG